jgi:hypothetical protein
LYQPSIYRNNAAPRSAFSTAATIPSVIALDVIASAVVLLHAVT